MPEWNQRFAAVPFNRHLDLEIVRQEADRAELLLPVAPWFAQEMGVIHGGILSALADTAAVYAILSGLPGDRRMTSIEFKVNFLAAGAIDDEALVGRSHVVKRGRTIAVCESQVTQNERLLLTGLFTYLLLE